MDGDEPGWIQGAGLQTNNAVKVQSVDSQFGALCPLELLEVMVSRSASLRKAVQRVAYEVHCILTEVLNLKEASQTTGLWKTRDTEAPTERTEHWNQRSLPQKDTAL